MRKNILWTGIIVFVLGVLLIFLSGASNGPSEAEQTPMIPLIYGTNQTLWLALAVVGIITTIVGLCLKKKTQKVALSPKKAVKK